MRAFIVSFFILLSAGAYSQHEHQIWAKVGVDGKIIKRLKWDAEFNARYSYNDGLVTFFPQVGLNYKITKWMRASVEYRFIMDKNKYGNYKPGNRLNFNVMLKENKKRFWYALRLRYQYAFDRLATDSYDADFDQAIRVKPSFEYDIKNSIFTPMVSGELFFNPSYGPTSPGFSKMRIAAGTKLELDGPHSVSIKYQIDKRFRKYSADLRHAVALSYGFSL